ncbi:MAG: SDR family NAD(P)-dependent oxidoreductase [Candidatus Omnitrophica bacterium]|nr:SDR family NAD(P)-dependent oxidoreductase [Candidatus Omnitrophota bacterium]
MPVKIALVTGGTRGIGKAIVSRFIKDGFHVVFTGRTESVSRAQDDLQAMPWHPLQCRGSCCGKSPL